MCHVDYERFLDSPSLLLLGMNSYFMLVSHYVISSLMIDMQSLLGVRIIRFVKVTKLICLLGNDVTLTYHRCLGGGSIVFIVSAALSGYFECAHRLKMIILP